MEPDNGKERAMEHTLIPELVPAPLSTSRISIGLPHLMDVELDEPSTVGHQDDNPFWNSTLEGKGEEPVLNHAILGRVEMTKSVYWVKGVPRNGELVEENEATDTSEQGGPVVQNLTFEGGPSSPSPISEDFNTDLCSPPTPFWPQHSDSIKQAHFEPMHISSTLFTEQNEPPQTRYAMRGGGQPTSSKFSLPPNILHNVTVIAQADPTRHHCQPVTCKARPTIGFKVRGVHQQERVDNAGHANDSTPNYSLPLWEYDPPRPSTADLENGYALPTSTLRPSQLIPVPESSQPTFTHKASLPITANEFPQTTSLHTPDIAEHPALRSINTKESYILTNGNEKERPSDTQELAPAGHEYVKSPLSHDDGIITDMAQEWPPTHQYFTPPEPDGRHRYQDFLHRLYNFSSTSSSTNSTRTSPSSLIIDDEIEGYMPLCNNDREPRPSRPTRLYEKTLANQAKSIRHLHRLVDSLTEKRDYYEQELLPKSLAHWSNTNKENHALASALREKEEENAMLWDLLEFSRKLLDLCWQRDEAVLHTAHTMRLRKVNRANGSLLERLVNSFGPGRGGEERGRGRAGERAKKRLESPFRDDLEQLVFVCEQNLRLLGEDLQDWSGNLDVVQGLREENIRQDHEEV